MIRPTIKTYTFILKYQEYINKINETTSSDDLDMYTIFKSSMITEGLIKTVSVDKSIDIISKKFPLLKCDIEDLTSIYIEGDFGVLSDHIPLFNNLGYFISKYTVDGDIWIKDNNVTDIPIGLYLEPKYDILMSRLPKYFYHATLSYRKDKILKQGLTPKSKNKIAHHPDRIYLTDELSVAKKFGEYISSTDKKSPYIIFKIDTIKLDIDIYRDINLDDNGFYTLDNIDPKYISLISF